MISESGSVEAMLRAPGFPPFSNNLDHSRLERLDPMQNQLCRVCEEPAAGFHFGAFTCEGCKSFFGRTCNNQSVIQECKNNYQCVVDKKNRTACKACRLKKCLMVGMSKSGSRYGRRSNWFKIHCLMQQNLGGSKKASPTSSSTSASSMSPTAPLGMWASPSKTEFTKDDIAKSPTPPSHSPDPPTMVPRTSIPTYSPPLSLSTSPVSPFKPLVSAVSPATSPKVNDISLSTHIPVSLASLYGGFPSPLSLMGAAQGFPGIPFHKQSLLSPLLAQSHLWQMAAARHPLLSGFRPELDLLAEHKALMERFARSAAASAAPESHPVKKEQDEEKIAEHQQNPIDLSSKKDDEHHGLSRKEALSLLKADVNRNLLGNTVLNLCSK